MSQMTFLFTDLTLDPKVKYWYGWIYCGVAALLTIVNVSIMAFFTFRNMILLFKKTFF